MSEEVIPTMLRNAAHASKERAQILIKAVEYECLEMPVTFKLPGSTVEVRQAYKPEDGYIVTVKLDARK
jgi:hypothetical protein